MKGTIRFIKLILNWYSFMIGIVGIIITYLLLFEKDEIPIKFNGSEIRIMSDHFSPLVIVSLISSILVFILASLYGIRLFQTVLSEFLNDDFFSDRVTTNLRKAGWLSIGLSIGSVLFSFLVGLSSQQFNFTFNFFPNSLLLLGLSLLVFSTVFQRAKTLQEENQLTI